MGAKSKQLIYTELSKLVESGFGIREAIGVMLDNRPRAGERSRLQSVLDGLNSGRSIADSFTEGSPVEKGVIEAGERSGKLGPAFGHLADYFELISGARRDALKALIYPLILLNMGLVLASIPSNLMTEGFNLSSVLGRFLMIFIGTYLVIGVLTLLVVWLLKMAPHSAAVDRLINAVPVVGSARRNLAMARFTKVYHAALVAGISMAETAGMAGEASNSGAIRAATVKLQEAVAKGQRMGPVFVAESAFPRAFAKSYASAEEAGMLDEDLSRWAKVFAEDASRGVKTLSVVLPKVGYVLVVGFVVWRILSFFSGYYGAIESIGI